MSQPVPQASPGASDQSQAGTVTTRSVVLGLACVAFVAAFAPYNDFHLDNTYFIGNHFPIGVTLLMVVLVLGVNTLLRCWRAGAALGSGELIVVWGMCLVGSAFPTAGLLRQLIPWMVTPIYLRPQHPDWADALAFLPKQLFPTMDPSNDAVVESFFLGAPEGQSGAVPWGDWAMPGGLWMLYFLPLFLGVLLLSVLMSRQWIVHEKLQFPIAAVMLEMVRDAPPGRRLNAFFRDRRMWLGAGVVMAIHLLNGLHAYYPKVPQIPRGYNMTGLFTEGFWAHFIWWITWGSVYFSMVGIAFLMASEVSLSLWLFILIYSTIDAVCRYNGVMPFESFRCQTYGAILAMGGYLLFLARSHLWRAFRVAFSPPRDDRDIAYLGYRWVVRGLLLCTAVSVLWLCAAGMSPPVALGLTMILYLVYLVLSRVVAETGMFFVLPRMWIEHLFPLMLPSVISAKDQALVIATAGPAFYPRETLMPFAFNALRLGHEAEREDARPAADTAGPGVRRSFVGALAAACVVSILVAGVVSLMLYYRYGLVRTNAWLGITWCENHVDYMVDYLRGKPSLPGQGPAHMAVGAGLIVVLGVCRVRFPRWPLVPIALCVAVSDALGYMWFSILIGWACKMMVMRLGGVSLYNRLRPLFLGMVIGEVLMAGIWMAVNACVRFLGYEGSSFAVLPG